MKKFSDAQLRKKYMGHIKIKLQASFLMLLSTITDVHHKDWDIPSEIPDDIKAICDSLLDMVKDAGNILSKEVEDRTDVIYKLTSFKEEVTRIYESIYCYVTFNNTLSEIFQQFQKLQLFKNDSDKNISYEDFYSSCLIFIEKNGDASRGYSIAHLMKCLPLKMTKDRYYEYVKNGLISSFSTHNDKQVLEFLMYAKTKFLPTGLDYYGKYFPIIKDELGSYLDLDFSTLTSEEIEENLEHLEDNLKILIEISSFVSLIFESINYLTLIVTFAVDLDYLLEDNLTHKDMYYTVCTNAGSDEFEIYKENFVSLCNTEIGDLIDDIVLEEKEGFLQLSQEDLKDKSETVKEIHEIQGFISGLYYEQASDAMYIVSPREENLNKEQIEKIALEFIQYMKEATKDLKPKTQKLIRQYFFSLIPSPFTIEEFRDYLVYVIESTLNVEDRLLIIDLAEALFEEQAFFDGLQDPDSDDEGCSCGHCH